VSAAEADWLAGVAIAPFPVADGTPLAGYMAREGSAAGTLDPLTVGALVLERDGERMVIVAADLAAVDANLVWEIASAAGIERSQLALCASHTHSGPAGIVARLHPASPNELDPALRARFVATAAATIVAARRDLQPVDLVFGRTEIAGVAANRNDPALSADERLSVLATRRGDGSTHCAIVHFACHPTILGAASRVVSADFPGALRRRLSNLLTLGDAMPVVLFVNGAAGDLSTRFTRRAQDAKEVERLGGLLAKAARDVLRAASSLTGPLRHESTSVALTPRTRLALEDRESQHTGNERREVPRLAPPRAVPPPDDPPPGPSRPGGESPPSRGRSLRGGGSLLRQVDIGLAAPNSAASSPGERRIAETRAQGTVMLTVLSALPEGAIATKCEIDAWALGELVLVSVPGELFASLGRQIATVAEPILVLGYTNGYIGYLADRRAHEAATYEALASPYGPEAGERVVAAAAELAAELRSPGIMASTSA
jgi:hypothetical protein